MFPLQTAGTQEPHSKNQRAACGHQGPRAWSSKYGEITNSMQTWPWTHTLNAENKTHLLKYGSQEMYILSILFSSALTSVHICQKLTLHFFFHRLRVSLYTYCCGIRTICPSGIWQSCWFPMVMESYYFYLAVFHGLEYSTINGMEQIYSRTPWTRLLFGPGINRDEPVLFHSPLLPSLFCCPSEHHDLLLWIHFILSQNGE